MSILKEPEEPLVFQTLSAVHLALNDPTSLSPRPKPCLYNGLSALSAKDIQTKKVIQSLQDRPYNCKSLTPAG